MAFWSFLVVAYLFSAIASAIDLNLNDTQSIRNAAFNTAYGTQNLYNGNEPGGTRGKFPYPPYYWWESGGAWGGFIHYQHYTGDSTYQNVTYDAITSQLGPNYDFVVPAEDFDEGNDDQAFWVFAAMSAAEYGFPDPAPPAPAWLITVENAWNLFVSRWSYANCNGGLKWQFYPNFAGYTYKNSISNGAFFQLSARLARYTGNSTYVDWAEKIYDWTEGVGLIDNLYNVFDGTDETINCSQVDHHQWTYNVGVFLYGSAVLSNYTNGSANWVERTQGFLSATATFFSPFTNASNIMFEAACEPSYTCDIDQLSMKAYLARWLAATSVMAPYTAGRIGPLLQASALGAASACTGGADGGQPCGTQWYAGGYDGHTGLGQQLSAMEVMYALLVNETTPPLTSPGVIIRNVPDNVTSIVSATNTPTGPTSSRTARPLYGGSQGIAEPFGKPSAALMLTLWMILTAFAMLS